MEQIIGLLRQAEENLSGSVGRVGHPSALAPDETVLDALRSVRRVSAAKVPQACCSRRAAISAQLCDYLEARTAHRASGLDAAAPTQVKGSRPL